MIRHPVEEKVEQPVVDIEEQPAVVVFVLLFRACYSAKRDALDIANVSFV